MSAFSGSFLFSLFLNEGGGQTRSVRIAAIWPSSEFDTRIKIFERGFAWKFHIRIVVSREENLHQTIEQFFAPLRY